MQTHAMQHSMYTPRCVNIYTAQMHVGCGCRPSFAALSAIVLAAAATVLVVVFFIASVCVYVCVHSDTTIHSANETRLNALRRCQRMRYIYIYSLGRYDVCCYMRCQ